MARAEEQVARTGDVAKMVSVTAASLLRMQAHAMHSQGEMLIDMSEKLREQADRIEHGGELPDLRVVPEPEGAEALPRIEYRRGVFCLEGAPDAARGVPPLPEDVHKFLGTLHTRWTASTYFVDAWNDIAAGALPSFDIAQAVVAEVKAREGWAQ